MSLENSLGSLFDFRDSEWFLSPPASYFFFTAMMREGCNATNNFNVVKIIKWLCHFSRIIAVKKK